MKLVGSWMRGSVVGGWGGVVGGWVGVVGGRGGVVGAWGGDEEVQRREKGWEL